MKKPKIGIAISLHNKFEELGVLVDIIRKNWKDRYVISVHSNYPQAQEQLEKLDIDTYSVGEEIFFRPEMNLVQKRVSMACRVFDCIKKSCAGADKLGCDYVMHLHTDAWPLKESAVKDLVKKLEETKKILAIRGMGFSRYRHDCPLGHVDDMFFVYNVKLAKKIGFLDVNPLTLLPTRLSMHGILSTLCIGKVHLNRIYFYDNYNNNVYWDNKRHCIGARGMLPTALDPKMGFLHVHRGGLLCNFSEQVQAMYLQEHGLTKGKHIREFLNKYLVDKSRLLSKINQMEDKINNKLQWRGFPIVKWGRFGRDLSRKKWYLELPFKRKVKYWALTMLWNAWESTIKKKLKIDIAPDYNIWPESLDSFYSRELNPEDFSPEIIWYEPGQKTIPKTKKKSSYARYNVFWWN